VNLARLELKLKVVFKYLKVSTKMSVAVGMLLSGQISEYAPALADVGNDRADYTAWLKDHAYWREQHPQYVGQMIYEMPIGKSPSLGPPDAKVTIVEFVDFSDSYSRQLAMGCHSLMMRYPGKVRVVFKNYPNAHAANSMTEHKVAMAALLQGQFWPVYSRLFLLPKEDKRDEETYLRWAKELKLDVEKFQRDRNSPEVARLIDSDINDARSCKMTLGAPKFFLNGRRVVTPKSMDELANGVEYELME
jgi:protein-disulfide isomerase